MNTNIRSYKKKPFRHDQVDGYIITINIRLNKQQNNPNVARRIEIVESPDPLAATLLVTSLGLRQVFELEFAEAEEKKEFAIKRSCLSAYYSR